MIIKRQHPKKTVVKKGEESQEPDLKRWYFEIQSDGNYETLVNSEIYNSEEAMNRTIDLLVNDARNNNVRIVDATKPETPS
jgi:uncharacterized protein YegP (UPF0339 family)